MNRIINFSTTVALTLGLAIGYAGGLGKRSGSVIYLPAEPLEVVPERAPATAAAIEHKDVGELVEVVKVFEAENAKLRKLERLLRKQLREYEIALPSRRT